MSDLENSGGMGNPGPVALDDEDLVAALRAEAGRRQPPPQAFLELARATYELRDPDAALLELLNDSLIDAGGTRSGGRAMRQITYDLHPGRLELLVSDGDVRGHLYGGDRPSALRCRTRRRQAAVAVSADGSFVLEPHTESPFMLELEFDGAERTLTTEWLLI